MNQVCGNSAHCPQHLPHHHGCCAENRLAHAQSSTPNPRFSRVNQCVIGWAGWSSRGGRGWSYLQLIRQGSVRSQRRRETGSGSSEWVYCPNSRRCKWTHISIRVTAQKLRNEEGKTSKRRFLGETQRKTGQWGTDSTWISGEQRCGSEEELRPILGYFWSWVCLTELRRILK